MKTNINLFWILLGFFVLLDIIYIALTLALFALVALIANGVERL